MTIWDDILNSEIKSLKIGAVMTMVLTKGNRIKVKNKRYLKILLFSPEIRPNGMEHSAVYINTTPFTAIFIYEMVDIHILLRAMKTRNN